MCIVLAGKNVSRLEQEQELPNFRNTIALPFATLAAAALAGCGVAGPDLDGDWVTASMNDQMECSMGRVMRISGDRIDFAIAGQIMATYEGLETSAGENGTILMASDSATFEFRPGANPDVMTIIAGPMVMEHHTSRLPKELGRCG